MRQVICGRPYLHRVDFCFWSAPPRPLLETLKALSGDVEAFAMGADCQSWLCERVLPMAVENTILCGAHARGVRLSPLWDSYSEADQPACRAPVNYGCVASLSYTGGMNRTALLGHHRWSNNGKLPYMFEEAAAAEAAAARSGYSEVGTRKRRERSNM